jgi:hypothetical protein
MIYYYNASNQLEDPPDNITIKLYDPLGDLNETKNATRIDIGKYSYTYQTYNTSLGGNWRLEAKTGTVEATTYWYLYSGPFDVKIIQITDNIVPDITAEIMLNNTGDPKDVTMYYWIEYLNGTKVAQASETWFAQAGVEYKYKTLSVPEPETYVYKVLLRWAPYREAGSSLQFEAVTGAVGITLTKLISPDWLLPKTKEVIAVNTTLRNSGGTNIVKINLTDEVPFDFDAPSNTSVEIWFINSTHDIKLTKGYFVNVSNADADNDIEISLFISDLTQTDIGKYLEPNEYLRMSYQMISSEMLVNTSRIMTTDALAIDIGSQIASASLVKTITAANAFIRAFKKVMVNPKAPTNVSIEIILRAIGGNITDISLSDYLPQGAEIFNLNVTYFNKTSLTLIQLYNLSDYLMTGPREGILPDGYPADIYFYNFSYNFTNWDGTLYEGENITITYNATIIGGGTWNLPAIVSGFDPQYKKFIRTEVQTFVRVPLFDAIVKVLTKKVRGGEIVKALFSVFNVGGPKVRVDVFLTYSVKTMEGALITEKSKTIAVMEKKEEVLELQLPEKIKPGMYTFEALATYSGREALATDVFEVVSLPINLTYLIIGSIISISVLLLVFKFMPVVKIERLVKQTEVPAPKE